MLSLFLSSALLLTSLPLSAARAQTAGVQREEIQRQVEQYNYIIGANAFDPGYQFTEKDPLIEMADEIIAWGSNLIKFNARNDTGLVDRVLEGRDFTYVFMWFCSSGAFRDGYSEAEARADYDAFYAFTKKLLQTYNGTGKQFFLGHWEGDWYYLEDKTQQTVGDTVTQGMIAWLNNRQKAVDDARRDTPHENVFVWHYLELNRPVDAIRYGYDRVVNRVLPFTNVDYVSYSAYDSKNGSTRMIRKTVDYIYQNLPEKGGVPGPRVLIGEIAEPAVSFDYNDKKYSSANLRIMAKYLQSDIAFCLYWEMYCNEKREDGSQNGYWLIDSSGSKTRLYQELQEMYRDGKEYVERFAQKNGRVPDNREYRSYLLQRPVFLKARLGVFFADIWYEIRTAFVKLVDLFRQ